MDAGYCDLQSSSLPSSERIHVAQCVVLFIGEWQLSHTEKLR
jgi:hypothetical protein